MHEHRAYIALQKDKPPATASEAEQVAWANANVDVYFLLVKSTERRDQLRFEKTCRTTMDGMKARFRWRTRPMRSPLWGLQLFLS